MAFVPEVLTLVLLGVATDPSDGVVELEPAPSLELDWAAPTTCPGEAHIHREVHRLLGPHAAGPSPRLSAEGTVETTDDGFVLRLIIHGTEGERTIAARDCVQLADAAALVIAIAMDPRVLDRVDDRTEVEPAILPEPTAPPPELPSEPEPTSPPKLEPPPTVTDTPTTTRERERLRVALAAQAGLGLAILPGLAADLGVLASIGRRWWRVELGGSYWTPSEHRARANPAVGGRFALWGIDARGCATPGFTRIAFPICAGVQVGAMHGRGVGALASPRSNASLWAAALGSVAALVRPARVERLGFGLRLEGVAALTRPSFGTDLSGEVYRARPGGARIGALVEVRLR